MLRAQTTGELVKLLATYPEDTPLFADKDVDDEGPVYLVVKPEKEYYKEAAQIVDFIHAPTENN